jgi:hypothetical protein
MSRIIIEHTGQYCTERSGITGAKIIGELIQNLLLAYTTVVYELKQTGIIPVIDKNEQTTIGRERYSAPSYLSDINIGTWRQHILGHHINDKRTDSRVTPLQPRLIGTGARRHIITARHRKEEEN